MVGYILFDSLHGDANEVPTTYTVNVDEDWGSGYCAEVTVTNNSSEPVEWLITFNAQGDIYNIWNAEHI